MKQVRKFFFFLYHTKSQQIKCWFLVRGEDQSTQGKTSQGRIDNQQTQRSLAFTLRYMMFFSFRKLFLDEGPCISVNLKIIIILTRRKTCTNKEQ